MWPQLRSFPQASSRLPRLTRFVGMGAPREVTPIAEGLLPVPEEPPAPQLPGQLLPSPPGLRGPLPDASRRSSIQEPAQETQSN